MAIELISCPACGTKNASHRSACLKCGVSLSAKESPGKREDLGRTVSQFVEKRVDGLLPSEAELWEEAVCAALFSVAFEIVIHLDSAGGSPENLERETKAIIEATCAHAAPWVNDRVAEETRRSIGFRVEHDIADAMHSRMLQYFDIAYRAIADRGYEPQVARSHACYVGLRAIIEPLSIQGLIGVDEGIALLDKVFRGCEEMGRGIREALDRYHR